MKNELICLLRSIGQLFRTSPFAPAAMVATIGCVALASDLVAASDTPPNRMTVQSYITDDSGTPLGNASPVNKKMIFSLYTADTGGSIVFADEQIVTVDKGHFSVVLGEGSTISGQNHELATAFGGADASDRFLEIQVSDTDGSNSQTLSPRLRLLPSAYAFLASYANEAARVSSGGIDEAALSNDSVTTDKMATSSVTSAKIAPDTIAAADIASDAVGASELADDSVDSASIINGSVSLADMASNSVGSPQVVDNSLTSADIAADAVGASELANNSVDSSNVIDNTLTAADLAANSVSASELANNAVGSANVVNGSLSNADLADNSVRASELVNGLFEFENYRFPSNNSNVSHVFTSREVAQWWPILIGWTFGTGDWQEDDSGQLLELSWYRSGEDWELKGRARTHRNNADILVQILWIPSSMVNDFNSSYKGRIRSGDSLQN